MAEHMGTMGTAEHDLVLKNRNRLELTGVCDVSALSPDAVEMTLREGSVAVDGKDLKIDEFSSETGRIRILGEVCAVTYFERSAFKKGGLFRRKS